MVATAGAYPLIKLIKTCCSKYPTLIFGNSPHAIIREKVSPSKFLRAMAEWACLFSCLSLSTIQVVSEFCVSKQRFIWNNYYMKGESQMGVLVRAKMHLCHLSIWKYLQTQVFSNPNFSPIHLRGVHQLIIFIEILQVSAESFKY